MLAIYTEMIYKVLKNLQEQISSVPWACATFVSKNPATVICISHTSKNSVAEFQAWVSAAAITGNCAFFLGFSYLKLLSKMSTYEIQRRNCIKKGQL